MSNDHSSATSRVDLGLERAADKVTWGPWTAIIVALVVYVLAQVIAIEVTSLYGVAHHWSANYIQQWLTNNVLAQFSYVLIAECLTIGFLIWFIHYVKHSTFRAIGLLRPKSADVAYALTGLVIYFPIYIVAVTILTGIFSHLNVNQAQDIGFSGTYVGYKLVVVFISLVILPPITEEIMFRGFLYSGLKKAMPVVWAIVVTSLIFALPHLFEGQGGGLLWIAGIDTFVLSLVLCWLREKTGRLYAGMGLHALKNFIAFFVLYLAPHIQLHGLHHL